jgi:uncharacterized membrane protein
MLWIEKVAVVVLLTLVPGLELRASIPAGILWLNMDPATVLLLALISNILLGPLAFFLIGIIAQVVRRWVHIERLFKWLSRRAIKRASFSRKLGVTGIALFIAIPLPGSGSYSGAIVARAFRLNAREFCIANTLGVTIAGIVVFLFTIKII